MTMPEVEEAFAGTLEELRAKQAAALAVIAQYPQVAAEVYAAMESAVADAQAAAAMQANTNALRVMIDYSGAILREAAQQYVPPAEADPEGEPEPEPEPES